MQRNNTCEFENLQPGGTGPLHRGTQIYPKSRNHLNKHLGARRVT